MDKHKSIKEALREAVRLFAKDVRSNLVLIVSLFSLWLGLTLIFHNFCPLVLGVGFPCPGCGLTRAAFSLLHLSPRLAWQYNPCIFIWLPLAAAYAVQRYIRRKPAKALRPLLFTVALLTIAVYIWRITHQFPSHSPMAYEPYNMLSKLVPRYGRLMEGLFLRQ